MISSTAPNGSSNRKTGGLQRQRAGQRAAHPHAARQRLRVVLLEAGRARPGRSPRWASWPRSALPHAVQLGEQLDVLLDRAPRQQRRRPGTRSRGARGRSRPCPRGRLEQPGGDPQQRRLAAPGRADDRDELALVDAERDVVDASVPSGNVIAMWSKVTPDGWVSGGEPRGMQFLPVASSLLASFAARSSGHREAARSASCARRPVHEAAGVRFGIFFELSVPRPFDGRGRAAGLRRTPSSRPSSPTSWASTGCGPSSTTSSRATPLLGAGGVPHRRGGADRAHPRRPRRRRVRAGDEPPGARRRAGGRARHPLRRPARARHGPVVDVDRARRLRRRPRPHQEDVGRVRARAARRCGPASRSPGTGSAGGCPSATCCRSRCRTRTRRCGSR